MSALRVSSSSKLDVQTKINPRQIIDGDISLQVLGEKFSEFFLLFSAVVLGVADDTVTNLVWIKLRHLSERVLCCREVIHTHCVFLFRHSYSFFFTLLFYDSITHNDNREK